MSGTSDIPIPSSANTDGITVNKNGSDEIQVMPNYEAKSIIIPQGNIRLDIIEIQEGATLTPFNDGYSKVDIFSDSGGYVNSVDTGDSTATYSSETYTAPLVNTGVLGPTENYSSPAQGGQGASVVLTALSITGGIITKVKAHVTVGGSTATVTIKDNSANVLATKQAVASGNLATVNFVIGDYTRALNPNETFTITWSSSSGNIYSQTSQSLSGTYWSFSNQTSSCQSGNTDMIVFQSYIYEAGTGFVQINLPTFAGTVTHTALVVRKVNWEEGDSITYDIENATQQQTGLAEEIKNTIATLTSNPTILKINLNPKSTSPTTAYPSIKSYCFMVWTSE